MEVLLNRFNLEFYKRLKQNVTKFEGVDLSIILASYSALQPVPSNSTILMCNTIITLFPTFDLSKFTGGDFTNILTSLNIYNLPQDYLLYQTIVKELIQRENLSTFFLLELISLLELFVKVKFIDYGFLRKVGKDLTRRRELTKSENGELLKKASELLNQLRSMKIV
jgi:hypothetical protein